jgi:hypothetical protein
MRHFRSQRLLLGDARITTEGYAQLAVLGRQAIRLSDYDGQVPIFIDAL